jgi:hypothetical protein
MPDSSRRSRRTFPEPAGSDAGRYAANLMSICPKSMWPAVKAMLHSVYDQSDAPAVHAQFDRLLDEVTPRSFPLSPSTSPRLARTSWP